MQELQTVEHKAHALQSSHVSHWQRDDRDQATYGMASVRQRYDRPILPQILIIDIRRLDGVVLIDRCAVVELVLETGIPVQLDLIKT